MSNPRHPAYYFDPHDAVCHDLGLRPVDENVAA